MINMPLTDEQCEKLCDAILNVYPYENKVALESLLNEKFGVKLEFTDSYSYPISANHLSINIPKKNKKLKILVFQANTKNLNLNQEFYCIESAIEKSPNRSLFDKPIFKPVYSTDDIRRAIANENPQIVHFCGHALEDGSLKLENDSNESFVSPETLKSFFEGREDIIKCVLLNACDTAEATVAISHHIDYTIGMNDKIIDEVAIEFAKGFYDGLGSKAKNNNKDIFLMAFNEGVRTIIAKNISQKLIPVVKKRRNYRDVILMSIKNINKEKLIETLKSDTNFYKNKFFIKFYVEYSYLIKQDDLSHLSQISSKIEYQNLVKAYKKTLPKNATVDNSELNNPENIDNIIDILRKDFPESDSNKVPSILVFAINLAEEFDKKSQEHQTIKSWVEKISSKLSIPISVKAKDDYISREFYTYLLIIVNDEGNKFNLRAEYILKDENLTIIQQKPLNLPEQKEQTGITCDSFNEIPHQVQKYYDELFNQLSNHELKNITIELFLPSQYFLKNLDKEWFINHDNSGWTPIVREYNIVVRLSDRLNKKFCIPLENNFERFNNSLREYSDEDILNKEIEIINQKVVDSNFQKISENFKDKKIGVKLIYNGIPETAFFRAIIRGAIGIAFWIRCSIPEDSNFSDIDNHLKLDFLNNNCRNLIEKMHELRKEASYNDENNDENFYPIGFLCDNPKRIPNIKPLKSF